ncbi:MAG: phage major capsid protein, partial [Cloacibacillus sp.]
MKKDEYKTQRDGLMKVANDAVTSGDLETARKTRAQIEALDAQFEDEMKELANITALEQKKIVNLAVTGSSASIKGEVIDRLFAAFLCVVAAYPTVFAKRLQGRNLTNEEQRVFDIFNPLDATQTTSSHTAVIPTTLMSEIFTEASVGHPILAAVNMTNVKGYVTYPKETSAGDAAWYGEADTLNDSADTTGSLELKGYPLSKVIPISYTLKEMATDAFLIYIRTNIADKIGAALATAIAQGQGVP